MSDLSVHSRPLLQSTQPTDIGSQRVESRDKPQVTVKSDVEARAAQKKILNTIGERDGVDWVRRAKVVSEPGMTAMVGKASTYAHIKDAMMRTAHRIFTKVKVDEALGSNHMSVIRLAKKYDQQKQDGVPSKELRATLEQLKSKLDAMHDRQMADAYIMEAMRGKEPTLGIASLAKSLSEFVDHELAQLPCVHKQHAKELAKEYEQLKRTDGPPGQKIIVLEKLTDHLRGADPTGKNPITKTALERYEQDLAQLKGQLTFKDELHQFGETGLINGRKLQHVEPQVRDGGLSHAELTYDLHSSSDRFNARMPKTVDQGHARELTDPSLKDLPRLVTRSSHFTELGKNVSQALNSGDQPKVDQFAKELGQRLANGFSNGSYESQLALITGGDQLKQELYAELSSQPGADPAIFGSSYKDAPQGIKDFLDKAVSEAAMSLRDYQVRDDDTLVLAGDVYTKKAQLGEDGTSKSFLYEGTVAGEPFQIAVRVPKNPTPSSFESTAQEARAHFSASSTEAFHPNLQTFLGAIRSPDGGLITISEYCPGSKVDIVGRRINELEQQGVISSVAANRARLALIKDMAGGLQQVQEEGGMTHNNLNPGSFQIGDDGHAKLGNFSGASHSLDGTLQSVPQDSRYAPPETMVGISRHHLGRSSLESISAKLNDLQQTIDDKDFTQLTSDLETLSKSLDQFEKAHGTDPDYPVDYAKLREQIKELDEAANKSSPDKGKLGKLSKKLHDDMRTVFDAHLTRHRETTPPPVVNSGKSDIWAFGVAAYELMTGKPFYPPQSQTEFEAGLLEIANQKQGVVGDVSELGGAKPSDQGAGAFGRLLNRVLQKDSNMRPTVTDILKSSLFLEPGIDSDEVRNLIKLLGDPNATPAQLKEASDAIGV
jgi:hypothetical protein